MIWPGRGRALIFGNTSCVNSSFDVQKGWLSGTAKHMNAMHAQYLASISRMSYAEQEATYWTARTVVVLRHLIKRVSKFGRGVVRGCPSSYILIGVRIAQRKGSRGCPDRILCLPPSQMTKHDTFDHSPCQRRRELDVSIG